MKTSIKGIIAAIAAATPSYASTGQESGNGMLMALFFGFAALIIAFQLVPALLLLFGMVKGLFSAVSAPAQPEVKQS
ncbi:hypothetical protein LPW11_04850 [Geomonas sp. RF6]|uniref:hypothetical protein n=1 Tax=Geomonas sp. RF6 TaxID=2897342 RepID=UPI001E365F86|nr:hypothetical protein [Geomonas sp. RF6]UFS71529.1 hypothetical protein LPW11_04850 [Geomonas sp. RF6]